MGLLKFLWGPFFWIGLPVGVGYVLCKLELLNTYGSLIAFILGLFLYVGDICYFRCQGLNIIDFFERVIRIIRVIFRGITFDRIIRDIVLVLVVVFLVLLFLVLPFFLLKNIIFSLLVFFMIIVFLGLVLDSIYKNTVKNTVIYGLLSNICGLLLGSVNIYTGVRGFVFGVLTTILILNDGISKVISDFSTSLVGENVCMQDVVSFMLLAYIVFYLLSQIAPFFIKNN